jgi:hypothetical protein
VRSDRASHRHGAFDGPGRSGGAQQADAGSIRQSGPTPGGRTPPKPPEATSNRKPTLESVPRLRLRTAPRTQRGGPADRNTLEQSDGRLRAAPGSCQVMTSGTSARETQAPASTFGPAGRTGGRMPFVLVLPSICAVTRGTCHQDRGAATVGLGREFNAVSWRRDRCAVSGPTAVSRTGH